MEVQGNADDDRPDPREWHWIQRPKDQNGRPKGHPEYDPTTIYISKSDFSRLTPNSQQYWSIKSKHWDSLVFFRVGNFFELYNRVT